MAHSLKVESNGLILYEQFIPVEILVEILKNLTAEELVRCRCVCKNWKSTIDKFVWKCKAPALAGVAAKCKINLKWISYYWASKLAPFDRNLLKNPCGTERLDHWDILLNGGHHWDIEDPPVGCDPVPQEAEASSCFVSSYTDCIKEQNIQLSTRGLTDEIMNLIKPEFHIREWFCGRFDCNSVFKVEVRLLNEDQQAVGESFTFKSRFERGGPWQKIEGILKNYPPGVRYLRYRHAGHDTQYWAGRYGSKMTGATVICKLPNI